MFGLTNGVLTSEWLMAGMSLYALAALAGCAGEIQSKPGARRLGFWLLAAACALNAAMIGLLWANIGRPPFKTVYETMLLSPFCIAIVGLIMIRLHRLPLLTILTALGSFACLYYAHNRPDWEVVVLPPALQSAWFVPHVVTYFIAYAALFISCALAVIALAPGSQSSRAAGPGAPLSFEDAANKAAVFGFVTLTLGLAMGAAWGKSAWGEYWQWDPKENWAFITWLAYLAYHHLRLLGAWRQRRAMWMNILCFGIVLFTYLGIQLLPTAGKSMHVYQ